MGEVNFDQNIIFIFTFTRFLYRHTDLNISTGRRTMSGKKIDLSPTKAASQGTQLSGVKLIFINYRRLKFQKNLVGIGLSSSGFSFYKHFSR